MDFLKAIEIWKGRLFAAETENKQLRDAIQNLHRIWFTGIDVDKDAVTAACLSLFRVASQSPAQVHPIENADAGQSFRSADLAGKIER